MPSCKKYGNLASIFLARLARRNLTRKLSYNFFLQDSSYLARKASFLVQNLQDLVQDLASLARKIFVRFPYFLQDGFYWVCSKLEKL